MNAKIFYAALRSVKNSFDCFILPVPFYAIALYTYYHGIIDHSGVNFKAFWWQPWQPDADFHDKHHEFFHCNFGFNIILWDKVSISGFLSY
jgi:Delta7-sterol 5-desaturase